MIFILCFWKKIKNPQLQFDVMNVQDRECWRVSYPTFILMPCVKHFQWELKNRPIETGILFVSFAEKDYTLVLKIVRYKKCPWGHMFPNCRRWILLLLNSWKTKVNEEIKKFLNCLDMEYNPQIPDCVFLLVVNKS